MKIIYQSEYQIPIVLLRNRQQTTFSSDTAYGLNTCIKLIYLQHAYYAKITDRVDNTYSFQRIHVLHNIYDTESAARAGSKLLQKNYVVLEIYTTTYEYVVVFTDESLKQKQIAYSFLHEPKQLKQKKQQTHYFYPRKTYVKKHKQNSLLNYLEANK